MTLRVCVVGGGLAGVFLAWRLAATADGPAGAAVDLVIDPATTRRDATAVSGGLVRGYETDPGQRALATASLAEILASPTLRDWSGYRRAGSVYIHGTPADPAGRHRTEAALAVAGLDRHLPGSARIADHRDLAAAGWAGLPDGTFAVLEEEAGHICPDRFRTAVLADLLRSGRARVLDGAVRSVRPAADHIDVLCDGGAAANGYDLVVLATGAWTPALLRGLGFPAGPPTVPGPRDPAPAAGDPAAPTPYLTKAIQYSIHPVLSGRRPPPFVDETTGLYGRPTPDGAMLLGVPTTAWHVDPAAVRPDPGPAGAAVRLAARRLPGLVLGPAARTAAAADCYTRPGGLALRAVPGSADRLLTFTGGSGGSAKTVPAASRAAARALPGTAARTPTGAPAAP